MAELMNYMQQRKPMIGNREVAPDAFNQAWQRRAKTGTSVQPLVRPRLPQNRAMDLAMREQRVQERGIQQGQALQNRMAMRRGSLPTMGGEDAFENSLLAAAMMPGNPMAPQAGQALLALRGQRAEAADRQAGRQQQMEIAKGGWQSQEKQAEMQVGVQREANTLRANADQMEREGRRMDAQLAREQADRLERESQRRFGIQQQQLAGEQRARDQQFGLQYQQGAMANALSQQRLGNERRAQEIQLEVAKLGTVPQQDKIISTAQAIAASRPELTSAQAVQEARNMFAAASGQQPDVSIVSPPTEARSESVSGIISAILSRPNMTPEQQIEALKQSGVTQDELQAWAGESRPGFLGGLRRLLEYGTPGPEVYGKRTGSARAMTEARGDALRRALTAP